MAPTLEVKVILDIQGFSYESSEGVRVPAASPSHATCKKVILMEGNLSGPFNGVNTQRR